MKDLASAQLVLPVSRICLARISIKTAVVLLVLLVLVDPPVVAYRGAQDGRALALYTLWCPLLLLIQDTQDTQDNGCFDAGSCKTRDKTGKTLGVFGWVEHDARCVSDFARVEREHVQPLVIVRASPGGSPTREALLRDRVAVRT